MKLNTLSQTLDQLNIFCLIVVHCLPSLSFSFSLSFFVFVFCLFVCLFFVSLFLSHPSSPVKVILRQFVKLPMDQSRNTETKTNQKNDQLASPTVIGMHADSHLSQIKTWGKKKETWPWFLLFQLTFFSQNWTETYGMTRLSASSWTNWVVWAGSDPKVDTVKLKRKSSSSVNQDASISRRGVSSFSSVSLTKLWLKQLSSAWLKGRQVQV